MKEIWPFHDEASGAKIQENRFYGFGDSGSLAGSFEGYETRDAAIDDILRIYNDESGYGWKREEIGTQPWHLSEFATTVLSGREFVERLKVIERHHDISIYGHWSEE